MAERNSTEPMDLWGNDFWKTCSRCKKAKPISEFSPCRTGRFGRHGMCKPCIAEHVRNWNKKHPQSVRKQNLHKAYGISLQEYESLLKSQDYRCAICKRSVEEIEKPGRSNKHLYVDHDHKTKEVRGVLCHHCNMGLGHFQDNQSILRAAADYLDRHLSPSTVNGPQEQ